MRSSPLVLLVSLCLVSCGSERADSHDPTPAAPSGPSSGHEVSPSSDAAPAHAKPSARAHAQLPPTPTYAQTRSYRKALAAGRRLTERGKHAAAVRQFEAALATIPGDARALSELSWAAFKAGDLDKAAATARTSVASTGDLNLKAASLYNLGRVQEARDQVPLAGRSYLRSYRLRPHATVGARLEALSIEIPAGKKEAAIALEGPIPDLEGWCAKLEPTLPESEGVSCYLVNTGGEVTGPKTPARLVAPWLQVGIFLADGAELECRLAVQTARGWFLSDPLFDCHRERVDVTIDSFTASANRLTLGYTVDVFRAAEDDAGAWGAGYASNSQLLVCGQGPSGVPSCAGPFDRGYADDWTMQFAADGTPVDSQPIASHFRFVDRIDDRGVLHITQGKRRFADHPLCEAKSRYTSRRANMGTFALRFQ